MATYIGRKSSIVRKPSKDELAALHIYLGANVRKGRPNLNAVVIPERAGRLSVFDKLTVIPSAVVNNPAALVLCGPNHPDPKSPAPIGSRWIDCMVQVPAEDSGAKDSPENVRLYLKNHLGAVIDPESVAIVSI